MKLKTDLRIAIQQLEETKIKSNSRNKRDAIKANQEKIYNKWVSKYLK